MISDVIGFLFMATGPCVQFCPLLIWFSVKTKQSCRGCKALWVVNAQFWPSNPTFSFPLSLFQCISSLVILMSHFLTYTIAHLSYHLLPFILFPASLSFPIYHLSFCLFFDRGDVIPIFSPFFPWSAFFPNFCGCGLRWSFYFRCNQAS